MGKKYSVLYADPPWQFGDKLPGPGRGAEKHYKVLDTEGIRRFPLPPLADDALLFLWRVSSQQEEALSVMRAWGFVPKSEIAWIKTATHCNNIHLMASGDSHGLAFGMGRYVRLCHEVCLIGARGRATSLIRDRAVRSVFFAPRGKHSSKPELMYGLIERLSQGPYAELFARERHVGWDQWGDELQNGRAAPRALPLGPIPQGERPARLPAAVLEGSGEVELARLGPLPAHGEQAVAPVDRRHGPARPPLRVDVPEHPRRDAK